MVGVEALIDAAIRRDIPPATRCVLMASRQAGKNQSNAGLEARVLAKYSSTNREAVKTAPTAVPTLHISKQRLKRVLESPLFRTPKDLVRWEEGYICNVGRARQCFLSAEAKANRVGHTASLYLSLDEAQDIESEIYSKDFRPMLLQTGALTILSGTSWSKESLIEQEREWAREAQKKLGIRLLYEIPWWRVAEDNPRYGANVEAEIAILGADHPIVASQYNLLPADRLGRLWSDADLAKMAGEHPRMAEPREGRYYVAGVDWSGASEQDEAALIRDPNTAMKRDSTVVTIGELIWKTVSGQRVPFVRVVDHFVSQGYQPESMIEDVYRFVFEKWRCLYCVSDASGAGNFPSHTLSVRRPNQVKPLISSLSVVNDLGYLMMGAVKTNRLKMYRGSDDDAAREFWLQQRYCRRELRSQGHMRFAAPPMKMRVDGCESAQSIHDDFVKSLAYMMMAAKHTEHLSYDVDPAFNRHRNEEQLSIDAHSFS